MKPFAEIIKTFGSESVIIPLPRKSFTVLARVSTVDVESKDYSLGLQVAARR